VSVAGETAGGVRREGSTHAWPGLFVAIEGIDGAGSTTQATAVAAARRERGVEVLCTREPSDGPVGSYIRTLLASEAGAMADPATVALLFAADRRDHLDREILPALARGCVVLTDRYVMSSMAYQGTELGDMGWVASINRAAPAANLTVLLDVPVGVAARRRSGRSHAELYERDPFLAQVGGAYRSLAAEQGALVLDGCLEPSALAGRIVAQILEGLEAAMEDR